MGLNTEDILFITLYAAFIAFLIAVNSAFLAGLAAQRRRLSHSESYLVSLAVADVAVALLVLPNGILLRLVDPFVKPTLCKVCFFFNDLALTARLASMVCVAWDKRTALLTSNDMFEVLPSKQKLCMNLFIVWLVSTIYAIFEPFCIDVVSVPVGENITGSLCGLKAACSTIGAAFILLDTVFTFLLPAIIIFYCYCPVITRMRRRIRDKSSSSSISHRRALQSCCISLCLFMLCKLPNQVVALYVAFQGQTNPPCGTIRSVVHLLTFIPGALQPGVTLAFNSDLRKSMIKAIWRS